MTRGETVDSDILIFKITLDSGECELKALIVEMREAMPLSTEVYLSKAGFVHGADCRNLLFQSDIFLLRLSQVQLRCEVDSGIERNIEIPYYSWKS